MTDHNTESQQGAQQAEVAALITLLRDSSRDPLGPYVPGRGEFAPRWRALAGLVKLGNAAVDPLCQALEDPNGYTRRFAAEALSRIGDARAVPFLVTALQESEIYVQRYLVRSLAPLGDGRAVEPLCTALQNPDLAQEALLALQAILARTAATISQSTLEQVMQLADEGRYVAETPNTDDGYLTWERVEHWLDHRPVKVLAQQELARRSC